MTPTARTLDALRCGGWTAQVVERWQPQARRRIDLFGIIDIVGIHETEGTLGVQACAAASHAARRTKAIAEPRLELWLRAGNRFQIVSWRKAGPRGKRKTWVPRVEELCLQDITDRPGAHRDAMRQIDQALAELPDR